MEVQLTPDQEALVRVAVQSGRLRDAGQAVEEAFGLWERREQRRLELVELLKKGEADLAAGRSATHTEKTLPRFFDDVKQEARAARKRE
jgi:Arc/MetJ-type ribon-helix-helix transcriptional regulator